MLLILKATLIWTFSLDIVRINTLTLILENKGQGEVTFITFNTDKKNNINYELKIG